MKTKANSHDRQESHRLAVVFYFRRMTRLDLYIKAKESSDKYDRAKYLAQALDQPEAATKLKDFVDQCFGDSPIANAVKDMVALNQIKDRRSKKTKGV